MAVRGEAGDREQFWGRLYDRATQEEYQWLLRTAWKLTPQDSLAMLGSSLEAHRSVVTAITCFAVLPDSYSNAVGRALSLGDDTDTLMGMAGALAGAHLGIESIPRHLVDRLENERFGRDEILQMADALHDAHLRRGK
jgi:poly(ADP-ribose) glycohydrolase ARH3